MGMEAVVASGGGLGGGGGDGFGGRSSPTFSGAHDDDALDGSVKGGGDGGDGGGFVQDSVHAGSYRIPEEAFLAPPSPRTGCAVTSWAGFQAVWSALPYVLAFAVESCPPVLAGDAEMLRTAHGIRSAMAGEGGGRAGGWAKGTVDARESASVRCPYGNTDYAVAAAWAFEAWDGTPLLCAITALKAPFSRPLHAETGTQEARVMMGSGRGGGVDNGGAGDIGAPGQLWSWCGRMEVRCGSPACARFVPNSAGRLARFVTNGTFALASSTASRSYQHQHQHQLYNHARDNLAVATITPAGGYHSGAATADGFSRTDLSCAAKGGGGSASGPALPPSASSPRLRGVDDAHIRSLADRLQRLGRVDTT